MQGFKLNDNGDVVVENGEISLVSGNDLMKQTVQFVMNTNKGEWFLNEEEGIDFFALLTKNPDEDVIRDELASALKQVDDTFVVQTFEMTHVGRNLRISFTARNDKGNEIGGDLDYGS